MRVDPHQNISNPYEILGITENASEAEIKAAFRTLAKISYPITSSSGNTARFIEIKEAYDILRDPIKRSCFATLLHAELPFDPAALPRPRQPALFWISGVSMPGLVAMLIPIFSTTPAGATSTLMMFLVFLVIRLTRRLKVPFDLRSAEQYLQYEAWLDLRLRQGWQFWYVGVPMSIISLVLLVCDLRIHALFFLCAGLIFFMLANRQAKR
ncbi:MAG TPA: J domain-containing protein [Ktedonobacteraceae bacterium]|jgi:curved DNA-binding protein CbpA